MKHVVFKGYGIDYRVLYMGAALNTLPFTLLVVCINLKKTYEIREIYDGETGSSDMVTVFLPSTEWEAIM